MKQYFFLPLSILFTLYAVAAPKGLVAAPPPVRFLGFSATSTQNGILLKWFTSEEVNASDYAVERSVNGTTWTYVGSVKATGNYGITNLYSFTDRAQPAKTMYYRIRQNDGDGRFVHTSVKKVSASEQDTDIKIYASAGQVVLDFPLAVKGTVEVDILSLTGRVVSHRIIKEPKGEMVITDAVSQPGIYVVRMQLADGTLVTQKISL